jgi:hypothetical protein
MTFTASPPRAVSLYLTFQPAALRHVALTRLLDGVMPTGDDAGEILGRIDVAPAIRVACCGSPHAHLVNALPKRFQGTMRARIPKACRTQAVIV